jgi:hypothetical protein
MELQFKKLYWRKIFKEIIVNWRWIEKINLDKANVFATKKEFLNGIKVIVVKGMIFEPIIWVPNRMVCSLETSDKLDVIP